MLAASAACLHRHALEIPFVARRGEHPGVPDRIGLQGVLLGEIDLFTGIGRARCNALALTRGLHAHSAVNVRFQVAARRNSPAGDTPDRGAHAGVLTSPSWDPVRPNRTHRAIQRALVSNRRLHVSRSWHRAPLLAEEELGAHESRGCRRAPLLAGAPNRMRQFALQSSRAKTSDIGRAVTALQIVFRDEMENRQVLENRRGSAFVVVRTPGGRERARRARSSVPPQGACRRSRRARKPA